MSRQARKRERKGASAAKKRSKESYQQKLSRAQDHLQKAEATITDWIEAARKTVVEQADPKRIGTCGAWITPPPLRAVEISLLVGDSLQCFRSALDHLALKLASSFTRPLPDDFEKFSEFPIFEEGAGKGSTGFHKRRSKGALAGQPAPGSGLVKVQGADPAAQAIIEGLQPYHRGQQFTDDPLWRLHELNRIDKHRLLHVVGATLTGFTWNPWESENVRPEMHGSLQSLARPVKGRTQVARWSAGAFTPIDPKKKMRVNFRPNLSVVFDTATPIVGDAPVIDILREIDSHIVGDVVPKLVGFLK